jgi:hypothetical protein
MRLYQMALLVDQPINAKDTDGAHLAGVALRVCGRSSIWKKRSAAGMVANSGTMASARGE